MNRDEWNQVLDTEPLTPNQRGAIMGEFTRLGIRDRAERLAACAALLGIDALATTADLTQGQAGQLVNVLERTTDRDALLQPAPAPTAAGGQAAEHHGQDQDSEHNGRGLATGQLTWPQALTRFAAVIYAALQGDAGSSAPGGRSLRNKLSGQVAPEPSSRNLRITRAPAAAPPERPRVHCHADRQGPLGDCRRRRV